MLNKAQLWHHTTSKGQPRDSFLEHSDIIRGRKKKLFSSGRTPSSYHIEIEIVSSSWDILYTTGICSRNVNLNMPSVHYCPVHQAIALHRIIQIRCVGREYCTSVLWWRGIRFRPTASSDNSRIRGNMLWPCDDIDIVGRCHAIRPRIYSLSSRRKMIQ